MTVMTDTTQLFRRGVATLFRPQRWTASERAYYGIKQMIARSELKPGGPLIIRTLAARLKVSRTPVVEALRRLEGEGLVNVVPKWGATVKEWSWNEIIEAYHIRRGLECEAAELFVIRATPEAKKRVVELSNLYDRRAATAHPGMAEADIELHLTVARGSRFSRLYALLDNSIALIVMAIDRAKFVQGGQVADPRLTVGVHKLLVQALVGENPRTARTQMWRHITHALEMGKRLAEEQKGAEGDRSHSAAEGLGPLRVEVFESPDDVGWPRAG